MIYSDKGFGNEKKIFLLVVLSFTSFVYTENLEKKQDKKVLIKRTVFILPFLNKNKLEKYEYLQDTLLGALTSELIRTDQFNLINQTEVEKKLKTSGYKAKNFYENKDNAIELAMKLKADVAVIGKYIIIDNRIMIQIEAIDIFSNQIVASTNIDGSLGIDIFRIIEESSRDIADKMTKELKIVDKSYFEEMYKVMRKKNQLDLTRSFNPLNLSGIILLSSGGGLFIAGVSIFIYDLTGYSNILREKKTLYLDRNENYNDYYSSYQIFIGLFCGGLITSVIGIAMLIIGIPFTVYKPKSKTLGFNINYQSQAINLFFKYQFN